MKLLLKSALTLAALFMSTFALLAWAGVLTKESIELFLNELHNAPAWIIAVTVTGLLFADLFIAVPTLTISLLAGFFLGFLPALGAVLSGFVLVGYAGYFISRSAGGKLLKRIASSEEIEQMRDLFQQYGLILLLICRVSPVLPEVSACLSGMSKMPLGRFSLGWMTNSLPYAVIATYAGSVSTLDNPLPALYGLIGISGILGLGWILLGRHYRLQKSQ